MEAVNIQHRQDSHGVTQLGKSETLQVSGKLGKVYYKGNPTIDKAGADESLKVISLDSNKVVKNKKEGIQYINIKIKNNSLAWHSFVIRGPKERTFSYGFSMFPFTTKKERVPVGTKFFTESSAGKEKLLVEVTAADEDKTIQLFK